MLDQDFGGRFATVILARLRFLPTGVALTLASAGHPPALILRAGGRVEECGGHGALLGIFEDTHVQEVSTVLQPSDALAMYTDGLLEARAPEQMVTLEQLTGQLERSSPGPAQETADALLELVDFEQDVRDDVAVVVARVTGASASAAG